jgi:hypothetical protein
MDRKSLFFIVFLFTLISTFLVGSVSLATGQGWLVTSLYSLVTMWIIGILAQVLVRHVYLQVVYPLEIKKAKEEIMESRLSIRDLEDVEEIDEAANIATNKESASESPEA